VKVLRGDVSLVGPRPLPVEYLLLYSPERGAPRHYRSCSTLTWDESFRLDVC
jgi:lipopolysaccharide/colanic/teichoic acid biosynthesis glycosyltransferase